MKALVICGATATGKTALAVACAKLLDGEIVSADSMLVYRGLDIGTAKPTLEERDGVPHHMIDVVSPEENFSVSDYERLAFPVLGEIAARGKVPVLCGGTGFYLNALLYRSSFGGTPGDPALRSEYEEIARSRGNTALHRLLEEADPESAAVLHENDVKRVVRALEIYRLTGKKKSVLQDGKKARMDFAAFAFDYPRERLYARIGERVDRMFEDGLVEEVQSLLTQGISETAQCMQGIGYKEVVEGLKNGDENSTMSDIIKKNTRNYAKRQLTFFKKTEHLHWLAPKPIEEAAREVCERYAER